MTSTGISDVSSAELRAITQKGPGELFFFSQYLYRPISVHLTRLYIHLGLSANAATLHGCTLAVAGAAALLFPGTSTFVMGAVALHLYFTLDHVDGELARFRAWKTGEPSTPDGEYFDYWVHFHSVNLAFAAVGVGLSILTGDVLWGALGVLADNALGNFPRLVLARTLWRVTERNPAATRSPAFGALVAEVTEPTVGLGNRRDLPRDRRIFLLLRELLTFPGCLVALSIALVGDAAFGAWSGVFHAPMTRTYLIGFVLVSLPAKLRRTVKVMQLLRQLRPPTARA